MASLWNPSGPHIRPDTSSSGSAFSSGLMTNTSRALPTGRRSLLEVIGEVLDSAAAQTFSGHQRFHCLHRAHGTFSAPGLTYFGESSNYAQSEQTTRESDDIVYLLMDPLAGTGSLTKSTSECLYCTYHSYCLSVSPSQDRGSSYTWQQRLSRLRSWRGDLDQGEASSISRVAISEAERLCIYADWRFSLRDTQLPTVLSPLSDGGVQVEWTVRGNSLYHLEVVIPPDFGGTMTLLRTEETSAGDVLTSYEVAQATLFEVLVEFEKVATKAVRSSRRGHSRRFGT